MTHIAATTRNLRFARRAQRRAWLRRNAIGLVAYVLVFALGVFFGTGLTVADLIWRTQ